jgi:4,5-DOPA dioxygenase extradiol
MTKPAPMFPGLMPALFVGHGSPMNAIEENAYAAHWRALGERLPRPKAILCISAHWQTEGLAVTARARPRTIHDFHGFPPELYQVQYAAPGAPELAARAQQLAPELALDTAWGLDHGAWSVLRRLYPAANVPVAQLSLDVHRTPQQHYDLAKLLLPLRRKGVLILGSGNLVHNLRLANPAAAPYDWALTFERQAIERMGAGDHAALLNYHTLGRPAQLAINSAEHYYPLLYVLALQLPGEPLTISSEGIIWGSISMACVWVGQQA